jgi:hypothetical protein
LKASESNENNNVSAMPLTILSRKVDLSVNSVMFRTSELSAGGSVTGRMSVSNEGNATAYVSTGYYLSADSVVDSFDQLLGASPYTEIAAGSSAESIITVTVPASAMQGNYYVILYADHANEEEETVELNNTGFKAVTVTDVLTGIPFTEGGLQSISIFPNPSNGRLTVELGGNASEQVDFRIEVIDLSGRTVYAQKASFFDRKEVVQLPGGMADGVYILRLKYDNKVIAKNILLHQ